MFKLKEKFNIPCGDSIVKSIEEKIGHFDILVEHAERTELKITQQFGEGAYSYELIPYAV